MPLYNKPDDQVAAMTWKMLCAIIAVVTSLCAAIAGISFIKADIENLKAWNITNASMPADIISLKSQNNHLAKSIDSMREFPARVQSLESEVKSLVEMFTSMTQEMNSVAKELRVLNLNFATFRTVLETEKKETDRTRK